MNARNSMSDLLRMDYKVFLEPVLSRACDLMAAKIGCRTRSKYMRYAIIRALIQDGYPLNKVSKKFAKLIVSLALLFPKPFFVQNW